MDSALIQKARAGDDAALEALIALYQARVARFVVALTGERNDYEDLCQAIFVKMVLSLPRLDNEAAFEAWLFRIAGNVCRDHLRRLKPRRRLFVPFSTAHEAVAAPSATESNATGPRALALTAGVQLDARERELLALSAPPNAERAPSYEALASALKVNVPTVKSRLYRLRQKLRQLLEGEQSDE